MNRPAQVGLNLVLKYETEKKKVWQWQKCQWLIGKVLEATSLLHPLKQKKGSKPLGNLNMRWLVTIARFRKQVSPLKTKFLTYFNSFFLTSNLPIKIISTNN